MEKVGARDGRKRSEKGKPFQKDTMAQDVCTCTSLLTCCTICRMLASSVFTSGLLRGLILFLRVYHLHKFPPAM